MVKFPYYVMRSYERIFNEDGYKCIETAKNRYVLDLADIPEGSSYSARRLELLRRTDLPYKIYPINITINSLVQMLGYGGKVLYTDDGNIVRWSKQKFYKVVDHLVQRYWVNGAKHYVELKDVGTMQVSVYAGEKYAKVVHFGNQRLFYGFSNTKGERPLRVKM